SSRSVRVGTTATAFVALINPSDVTAESCSIAPAANLSATFLYQTTDPGTNQLTGTPNTPVDIPGHQLQTFVIGLTPSATTGGTDLPFNFTCSNTATNVPLIVGVNTLLLVVSAGAVPDVIALSAAPLGIVDVPGATGTGLFAVATTNVGAAGTI